MAANHLRRASERIVEARSRFMRIFRCDISDQNIGARRNGFDRTGSQDPGGGVALKLRPGSYLVLGMVRAGVRTGYAIKRAVDNSTRFFWTASLAQVYPELAALADHGYLESSDEPHGSRPRKVYSLTEKGAAALDSWLSAPRTPGFEFRDEGMLRLFFADALSRDDAIALVRRLRAGAEELDESFREEILPQAEGAHEMGLRFPHVLARWGADYYRWRAEWLARLESELEADQRFSGGA
jgi:PadR family transcriptional regulator, regulatory protein AphA